MADLFIGVGAVAPDHLALAARFAGTHYDLRMMAHLDSEKR